MAWIVLLTLAMSTGLVFGLLAAVARFKGRRAAVAAAVTILVFSLGAGALAYAAYLEQRQGALPPDHFYNSVAGQIVIVGGLLTSIGGALGAIAGYWAAARA